MENIKETPLCKLAFKYGTDKCPRIKHTYTPIYYDLFKDKIESTKKVFEMGVLHGASLRMWRDFFPNAQVYGGDVSRKQMFEEERIKTFIVDETDEDRVVNLIKELGDIDLFVDDALHDYTYQVALAKMVLPLLPKGAIYIIEDVSHNRSITAALKEYDCETSATDSPVSHHRKIIIIRK